MTNYGFALPELFFSVVKSINEKPPFCEITLTEAQWLPDIEAMDLSPTQRSRMKVIQKSFQSQEIEAEDHEVAACDVAAMPELALREEREGGLEILQHENSELRENLVALQVSSRKKSAKLSAKLSQFTNNPSFIGGVGQGEGSVETIEGEGNIKGGRIFERERGYGRKNTSIDKREGE